MDGWKIACHMHEMDRSLDAKLQTSLTRTLRTIQRRYCSSSAPAPLMCEQCQWSPRVWAVRIVSRRVAFALLGLQAGPA
jgi:hypothetical protein